MSTTIFCQNSTPTNAQSDKTDRHFQEAIILSKYKDGPNNWNTRDKFDWECMNIYNAEKDGIHFVLRKLQSGNSAEKNLAAFLVRWIVTAEEGWMNYQDAVSVKAHHIFLDETIENLSVLIEALSAEDMSRFYHLYTTIGHIFSRCSLGNSQCVKWWNDLNTRYNPVVLEDEFVATKDTEIFIKECKEWWVENKLVYHSEFLK